MSETPEDVYRAAAEAALRRHVGDDQVDGLSAEYLDELITDWWDTPDSRARVDAAYAAGHVDGAVAERGRVTRLIRRHANSAATPLSISNVLSRIVDEMESTDG